MKFLYDRDNVTVHCRILMILRQLLPLVEQRWRVHL